MIILDATNKSIEVILTPGAASLPFNASYVDVTTTTYSPISNNGTLSSSATTVVAAPSTSTQRHVKYISVCNISGATETVTVQQNTATVVKILCKVQLQAGDLLQYTDGEGFTIIGFNGGIKCSAINAMALRAGSQSGNNTGIVFSNSNSISFGMTGTTASTSVSGGASITITASAGRSLSMSYWEVPWSELNQNAIYTNSTVANILNMSMQRFLIPYDIVATRLDFLMSLVAGNTPMSMSVFAGIYTRNGSQLGTASTSSSGQGFSSGGSTNQTNSYSGISGLRWRSLAPNSWSFTPGEYWLGCFASVQGNGASTASLTMCGQSAWNVLGGIGLSNDAVGNVGVYKAATGAFPATMSLTDIFYGHSNTGGSSGSFVLRQPYFRMFGTY